jgi:hypothetical protein
VPALSCASLRDVNHVRRILKVVKSSTDLAGFAKFWRRTQLATGLIFPSEFKNSHLHQ